jgi:hypothetical protein
MRRGESGEAEVFGSAQKVGGVFCVVGIKLMLRKIGEHIDVNEGRSGKSSLEYGEPTELFVGAQGIASGAGARSRSVLDSTDRRMS